MIQNWKTFVDDPPQHFVGNGIVAVDDPVTGIDDLSGFGDLDGWLYLQNPTDGFAYDLEVSLDRSFCFEVILKGKEIPLFGEKGLDFSNGTSNVS